MNRSRLTLSLAAGAAAFALALAVTEPLGPGLDPDARAYLYAASSLAHRGVLLDVRDDWVSTDSTRVLTKWPPGFPVAIALPVAVGAAPVQGARFVMALAAFAALATLVWLVAGAAGLAAGAVLAIALLVTPAMAIVHENVLSEPLFLATLAITLAMMARARPAPFAAGLGAAAASMVRYAGLSAVGAVVLWEAMRAGTIRDRARRAAIAAAPALIVNLWWWTRAAHAGGRTAVRHFSLYGQLGYTLVEGAATVTAWLAPLVRAPLNAWVAIGVIVCVGMMCRSSVIGHRPSEGGEGRRLMLGAALLTLCYVGLLLAARLLADPNIPLDERLLAPAMMLVMVTMVVGVVGWWRGAGSGWRVGAGLLGAAWCVGSLLVTRDTVRYALRTGSDYADICWAGSPVAAWVREHGAGHALVSNAPVALFFQAGRLVREMPEELDTASSRIFVDTLRARRAYVVLFDQSCASTIEQPDSLVRALGLVPEAGLRTGSVWRAPDAPR